MNTLKARSKGVMHLFVAFLLYFPSLAFTGGTTWVKVVEIQAMTNGSFYVRVEPVENINVCTKFAPNPWFHLEDIETVGAESIISAAYTALVSGREVSVISSAYSPSGYNNITSLKVR